MAKSITKGILPDEMIMSKILVIRGKKIMIDRDLAELYGVSTKRLNEQVKRNQKRFPDDFMFQLDEEEKAEVVANCDHLKTLKFSPNLPNAFTEHGAVMLASVLNSDTSIQVNIQTDVKENRKDITLIFEALKQLLNLLQPKRKMIGFNRKDDE